MFEHHSEPLLPLRRFILRLLHGMGITIVMVTVSLFVGTLGYRRFEHMSWIDAFYSASLIMSGMGPAEDMTTLEGKLFASLYAIFCGLFLIVMTGILFAPVFHRIMHKLHL